MSLFGGLFGQTQTPAQKAKERLMITLSHERAATGFPFLNEMREEIMKVVKRYVKVRDVRIHTEKNQHIDRLEIDVELES